MALAPMLVSAVFSRPSSAYTTRTIKQEKSALKRSNLVGEQNAFSRKGRANTNRGGQLLEGRIFSLPRGTVPFMKYSSICLFSLQQARKGNDDA